MTTPNPCPTVRARTIAFAMMAAAMVACASRSHRASADWASVDRAMDAALGSTDDSVPPERSLAAWNGFDSAVVAALDAGATVDSVNHALSAVRGFAAASDAQPTATIGGMTLWRELPRNAPTFFVASAGADAPDVLLGVFSYPWVNGPSHLSVYRRTVDGWTRSGGMTSDRQIEVHRIRGSSDAPVLLTVETYTRADGSESEPKLWRLRAGALEPIARPIADTALLQDADVEPAADAISIVASQFPRVVGACTMCTRLVEEHHLWVDGGTVHESVESLTPWADVVERLFAARAARDTAAARELFAMPALARRLIGGGEAEFESDTGDFDRGWGWADVSIGDPTRPGYWRLLSRRQADGRWRIVALQPGVWRGDSATYGAPITK